MGNNNKSYHAYISHKSDCKPWVKTLANGREIFLLISRFEHSSSETQEELAAILRSLGGRFARSLRVVIRGAERLYELAYIGPYQPYLDDPLLKELYWKNLLQKDQTGARLTWGRKPCAWLR